MACNVPGFVQLLNWQHKAKLKKIKADVIFRQPTLKQSAIIAQNLLLAAHLFMSPLKKMIYILEQQIKVCPNKERIELLNLVKRTCQQDCINQQMPTL